MKPLANLWTWTGHSFIPFAIGWAFFVREGLDTDKRPVGALISRGYWGLLLTLVVAALLIWVAALYVQSARAAGLNFLVIPNTTFEKDGPRNRIISWGTTILFILAITTSLILFFVRYVDSLIHSWDGAKPLDKGFLSSRIEAHRLGCPHQPCFALASRMDGSGKALTGVDEYILYISDGALLLAAVAAAAGALYLIAAVFRRENPTPFAS